jgi:hypothetical protein
MTWLLENPVPIWIAGIVLGTLAGLFFLTRRTLASLGVLAGIVGLSLLLVLLEWMVVTASEEVELATHQLAAAVEANDLAAVLALLDPTASQVRGDAQKFLARLQVAKAHVGGTLRVEIDPNAALEEATSRFRALIDAVDRRGGMNVVYYNEVQLNWVRQNEHWLVTAYTARNSRQ